MARRPAPDPTFVIPAGTPLTVEPGLAGTTRVEWRLPDRGPSLGPWLTLFLDEEARHELTDSLNAIVLTEAIDSPGAELLLRLEKEAP